MFIVAALAVIFLEHDLIRHTWISWRTPRLPPAISYQNTKEPPLVETKLPSPILAPSMIHGETPSPPLAESRHGPQAGPKAVTSSLLSPPPSINLAVPFTSQAPFAVWDLFHEEACEEASLYMVHRFYEGDVPGVIDPQKAEEAIQKVVKFEDALFGFNADTNAAQTGAVAEQFYGYERVETISNQSADDLKRILASGFPIIVPAAGQDLGNPSFSSPGPVYHMLVLRGYTEKGFITNDPGTRRGEGYVYPFDTIMNAMHDWNAEDIAKGAKTVLVVYPNL